jgi:hypothetical protein
VFWFGCTRCTVYCDIRHTAYGRHTSSIHRSHDNCCLLSRGLGIIQCLRELEIAIMDPQANSTGIGFNAAQIVAIDVRIRIEKLLVRRKTENKHLNYQISR